MFKSVNNVLALVSLVAALGSAILFTLGHVFAWAYYDTLGVDYMKLATIDSGFSFLLNNPVLFFFIIILIAFVGFPIVDMYKKVRSRLIQCSLFIYMFFELFSLALIPVAILMINFFMGYGITADMREETRDWLYDPIYVKASSIELRCVRNLGVIGNYNVFYDSDLRISLLKSSDIKEIQQEFLGVPKKYMENFHEKNGHWRESWQRICYSDSYDEENFFSNDVPPFSVIILMKFLS
ncbi:hypothetical protein [Marinomonas atlantica]|uniref:hypothetical protein n=1 Tax=Marinomonas atlantica TaxID=1806668 RepID=UPI00082D8FA5|nr:hypothetical protein [Marinomonas atlantica]